MRQVAVVICPLCLQMLVDVTTSVSHSCCSVTSNLRLSRVSGSDEGLYTCKPAGRNQVELWILRVCCAGVVPGPGSEDQIYLTVIQTPLVEERYLLLTDTLSHH